MTATLTPQVQPVASAAEACALLAELGEAAEVLAGGSWIMRAGLRGEPFKPHYLALTGLSELSGMRQDGGRVAIGALTTHAELATLPDHGGLQVLIEAARLSAFPQVRNVATVGGNLRSLDFAQADLVPALLAAEATIVLRRAGGTERLPIADYHQSRHGRPADELVVGVELAGQPARSSTYERLTIRASGEYAVAALAISIDRTPDGAISAARIAVGSVEPEARLLTEAPQLLAGQLPTAELVAALGQAIAAEISPRDGIDAPAWYRKAVLLAMTQRALARLLEPGGNAATSAATNAAANTTEAQ